MTAMAWRLLTISSASPTSRADSWTRHDEWYRRSLAIKEELGDRPGLAGTYSRARQHRSGSRNGRMRPTKSGIANRLPSAKNS